MIPRFRFFSLAAKTAAKRKTSFLFFFLGLGVKSREQFSGGGIGDGTGRGLALGRPVAQQGLHSPVLLSTNVAGFLVRFIKKDVL
jgi:hypothetical protein